MKVFAISDLHLSQHTPKAMDIFGEHWKNHFEKIAENWRERVSEEDYVLIAGDLSWAMHLEEAKPDLEAICALPGHKILIKGNHDFWHGSLQKTRSLLTDNTCFLQNDFVETEEFVFAGSRGWKPRTDADFTEQDEKIYIREAERLKLSMGKIPKGKRLIGMMHYPPFGSDRKPTEFTELFRDFGAEAVVYGHIHGRATRSGEYADLELDGVNYYLTSCDALRFTLREIAESEERETP